MNPCYPQKVVLILFSEFIFLNIYYEVLRHSKNFKNWDKKEKYEDTNLKFANRHKPLLSHFCTLYFKVCDVHLAIQEKFMSSFSEVMKSNDESKY